jgi:RNA polymerase sigma factor (sigma-70 family)
MLDALKKRDPHVQLQLRRELFPKVQAVCLALLKDRALAEETAEDTWMDFLYQHVDGVRRAESLAPYLRMMTVRRCVRIRQWRDRHDPAGEQPPLVGGSEDGMLGSLDRRRQLARLERCLERLTPKARRLLRLRYHHDLAQEAIGKALGFSKQYAGRTLARALELLRACVEEVA